MTFLGGGQEEIDWRGYIQPILEKRYGLAIGGLILGTIWAVWHLPLWIIPGTSQSEMNFFGFLAGSIAMSYFYSWIVESSGRRLLSGLFVHGSCNAIQGLFPLIIFGDEDAKQTRFWLFVVLMVLLGLVTLILRIIKNRKYCI